MDYRNKLAICKQIRKFTAQSLYIALHMLLNEKKIFDYATVGMKFSQVTSFAEKLFAKYGLANEIISITDISVVNIGHTIPATHEAWSREEQALLIKGLDSWEKLKHKISNKR